MVGCGSQRAIRTLAQRRARGMKLDSLVRNLIERPNRGRPGIIIMKFPGRNRAVFAYGARNLDYAGGPEVCPAEFFFARPDQLDGFARRLSQACRLERGFTRMLAAVSGTGVRDNHADAFFRNAKRRSQLAAHPKRALRSGPDGKFAFFPFCDSCARLERSMSDIGNGVGPFKFLVTGRQAFGNRAASVIGAPFESLSLNRILFQIVEKVSPRRLRSRFPLCANGSHGP